MSETKIYVNTKLMKVNRGQNSDTDFICDLGNKYTFKKLILNSFSVDNVFTNFYDNFADFSYYYSINDVEQPIVKLKCNEYLEKNETFLLWFNNNSPVLKLQDIPLPSYQFRLSYQAVDNTHKWRPAENAAGWLKLGFLDEGVNLNRTQTAIRCFDFTQSPTILIRFNNIPNQHVSSYGQFTYQVQNNSSFGGKIVQVFQNVITNQYLSLNEPVSINQLFITLLNCDMQPLTTVGSGFNDIEVILNLTALND